MKTGPTEKLLENKEKHLYRQNTVNDQKSNYGIPLDLWKRSSKTRENFVSKPQLNII